VFCCFVFLLGFGVGDGLGGARGAYDVAGFGFDDLRDVEDPFLLFLGHGRTIVADSRIQGNAFTQRLKPLDCVGSDAGLKARSPPSVFWIVGVLRLRYAPLRMTPLRCLG
jgi:hypothetical protein